MTGLLEIMKLNAIYYKEVDQVIEIFYKALQRSTHAVEYLSKAPTLMKQIEQWCKDNSHFPLNQQKMKVFKQRGVIVWNQLKQSQAINQQSKNCSCFNICLAIDKLSQYTKDRMLKMQSLVAKETPVNAQGYDSDDDFYHHNFKEKERVDFLDQHGQAHAGQVETVLEEMVQCVSDQTNPATGLHTPISWISTDSDKLAAPNSLSHANEKRKWNNFYMSLVKTINPN